MGQNKGKSDGEKKKASLFGPTSAQYWAHAEHWALSITKH